MSANANCLDFKDDLSAYFDGQLAGAVREDLEKHLGACEVCKQQIDKLSQVSTLIASSCEQADVPELWEGLSAQMPSVCEVIKEDLSAYIDQELPAAAQEGINVHLKECSDCCSQFQQLNSVNELVKKQLELPQQVEVDLWTAIKARLNEDCALIQSELSAYLDQEVLPIRHRAITAHIIECPNCKNRFEELSQVGEGLRSFYQPQFSEDFDLWPAIKSSLKVVPFAPKAQDKQRIFNHRLYVAAAAAVIVGLTGSLAFLFITPANKSNVKMVSAESYLLDSALNEPADMPEAMVYGNQ